MSNIEEIKNKYANTVEPKENKVNITKTINDGTIRVGVGLKKAPKKVFMLCDIFGKDYEINHNAEAIQTISTIGKAMQRIDGDDQISKIFDMFRDIFYVLFVNKEDADEILQTNQEFELQDQISNLMLIVKCALAVMSGKSVEEIDEMVNGDEVSEEQEVFRDEAK